MTNFSQYHKMHEKHSSGLLAGRPALKALIAYASGILIAEYLPIISITALFAAMVFTIIGLIYHLRSKSRYATIALYLALFAAGLAQYKLATSDFPPTHVKHIAAAGNTVTVKGDICSEPDIRSNKTYLTIDVDSLVWRRREFESCGKILLKINQPTSSFAFRDHIKFRGYLFEPGGPRNPGGFNFAGWLSNKEIFGMVVLANSDRIELLPECESRWRESLKLRDIEKHFINKLVSPLRTILINGYDKYLPSDQAALLGGFVLGEKRDLPDDTVRLFRDTGTLHLMAVSGSNVAIIAGFFLAITFWLNRRLRILITLCTVIFFCFLTRNEPSVVRASVMATVGLLGFYRQKNPDLIGLLGFSGLVLLIIQPLWLFNVGFQLSFAACIGIIYSLPYLTSMIKKQKSLWSRALHWTLFTLMATLAAQIAVLPFTAQYFNRVPVVGVLANIPMIGLATLLTIAGVSFLPFILLGDAFAIIFAWPLSKIMSMIMPLLQFFVDLPLSVINAISPGWAKIIMFFSSLYLLVELILVKRLSFKALSAALMSVAMLIIFSYLKGKPVESLTFIDCTTDRAILYSNPDGRKYLWYDCFEGDNCSQIEISLIPYLFKSGVAHVDTVFTNDSSLASGIKDEISVGRIVQHSDIIADSAIKIAEFPPYSFTESILNKTVKLVRIETDNNIETLPDRQYYRLSTDGGDCVLAGSVDPRFAGNVNSKVRVLELPWTAQSHGAVYHSIRENPPEILVFSPDKRMTAAVRDRDKLTYLNNRTWCVSFCGNFRVRVDEDNMHVDYMLEPKR